MPETMSVERRTLLAMLGAKLVFTPGAEGMKGAIARAEDIVKNTPGAWMPQQFNNPPTRDPSPHDRRGNLGRHRWQRSTSSFPQSAPAAPSPAAWKSLNRGSPRFKAVAVEPKDSPVISQTLAGQPVKPGPHKIQGTGAGFVPNNLHLKDTAGHEQITECIQVTNDDAFAMARRLAKEEGILAGISSGANVWAAIELAKRPENKGKTIVTIACSTGERYLSTPLAAEARAEVGG